MQATQSPAQAKKKEIYTHEAPWRIYGMNWSNRKDKPYRLALGSFIEEYNNKVEIVQLNDETQAFERIGGANESAADEAAARASGSAKPGKPGIFNHPYPTTKIMWAPETQTQDLLATTGDYLRLWGVAEDGTVEQKVLLNNHRESEFCAPLTSFDWNETDTNLIGTSSIDTTCTIWDVETQQVRTQLIAHDKEVYDIAFARGKDEFASVGADGSVRMFDLRKLEHSWIIYETRPQKPLLRLAWNKQDPHYLATIQMDDSKVVILDIRRPSQPVAELNGHRAGVNAIAWAPHSSCHICTAGDDRQALIWDLNDMPKPIEDPILAYNAESDINQLQWSKAHHDWVAIAFGNKLQILRV